MKAKLVRCPQTEGREKGARGDGGAGKCVSDGLRQQVWCVSGGESVGMWVAPIDPVKGEWELAGVGC